MGQNTAIRTTVETFPTLDPVMHPKSAREFHIVLNPASSSSYVLYPKGQIVRQKNDGTNNWAKVGTSGYGGPPAIIKRSVLVNDAGDHQLTEEATWSRDRETFSGSINAYYSGFFKTSELTGAGGTNEIQTLTFDTDVDGGTFTITWRGYTTAAIAWNATAATIKTAMLAAMPILVTGDLTASGSAGGPHTFTFTGAYAGANVDLLSIDISGLTDGGVAVTSDTTAVVESTPGVGLLTGIGRLVRGTNGAGILELGAATPS